MQPDRGPRPGQPSRTADTAGVCDLTFQIALLDELDRVPGIAQANASADEALAYTGDWQEHGEPCPRCEGRCGATWRRVDDGELVGDCRLLARQRVEDGLMRRGWSEVMPEAVEIDQPPRARVRTRPDRIGPIVDLVGQLGTVTPKRAAAVLGWTYRAASQALIDAAQLGRIERRKRGVYGPASENQRLDRLLALMGEWGWLRAADACEHFGWDKRACEPLLRLALRQGKVRRVRRGVYALAGGRT